jgi:ribosomal protein S18 acetylase RimI-like enzyme
LIRPYQPADLESLRQITITCFDGTSVDQNIERLFGRLGDLDWGQKKALTIDADADANPEGIFVCELNDVVVAYITSRINKDTATGWIPNMAVLPEHQKKGIGKALMSATLDYLESEGMELVRIETLVQNEVGPTFYPNTGFQEIARQIHYAMPLKNRKI